MAKETAYERQVREALEALPTIVSASQVEPYYMFTKFEIYSYLESEGLVVVNGEITNEAGEEATRATQKGIDVVTEHDYCSENPINEGNKKVMSETETVVETSFEIVNIPLPTRVRGGGTRKSQYPFASLEVGQTFFVAASEKHPEPAKSLASTVSAAMKKYDVPDIDEETGIQKLKSTRNPKTGEIKENVPCMKHTRKFSIVACDGAAYGKPGIVGAAIGRTA